MIIDLRRKSEVKFNAPIIKGSIKGQDNWTSIAQSYTSKKGDIVFVWKLWNDVATNLMINNVNKEAMLYTALKISGQLNIKVGVFVANEGDVFSFANQTTTAGWGHIGCGIVILPKA